MDDIKNRLIECLSRNGIDLFEEDNEIDSISFVTAIIDIEQEFDIIFPDEYLITNVMEDFEKLYNIVIFAIQNKV